MIQSNPHIPVLLEETISRLLTNPSGIYLDGTVGYGGHSEKILKKLSQNGMLIGMDLDPYALEYAENRLSKIQASYSLHHNNYREYPQLLQKLDIKKLTGILLDLGSSSGQINTGHRGFSFQNDAPLDMRFNPKSDLSAFEFLNKSNIRELENTINDYGEERNYKKIAQNIHIAAGKAKMNSTFDLKHAISKSVNPRFLTKSLARVFQAIRIKINDELGALEEALFNSINWLQKDGRIAILSFHSLEDRIVKKFFASSARSCVCPKEYPICCCSTIPTLKILTRKAIVPTKNEISTNYPSRSAKLRVAERI